MNFSSSKIETAANVATIGAAIVLSVVLIKTYLLPAAVIRRPVATTVTEATVGTNLGDRLPGIDWNGNRRTLVLAISTSCHFCTESAPFFRLLQQASNRQSKIVAVLPESVSESTAYLEKVGVQTDQVQQAAPGKIGIRGTPTMLLVDGRGTVTKIWVGKLDSEQQIEVLDTLRKG